MHPPVRLSVPNLVASAVLAIGIVALGLAPAGIASDSGEPDDPRLEFLFAAVAEVRAVSATGAIVAVADATDPGARLDRDRLATLLAAVDEAEAWPQSWVVVQDATTDEDLVMAWSADGDRTDVRDAVLVPSREWDAKTLRAAVRGALGRKPSIKFANVVVQGFSKRIVTRYPYDPPQAASRGLLAALEPGAILRQASNLEVDGTRRTVAVVFREAEFVPGDCGACPAAGHVDRARVELVIAGDGGVEHRLDVTERLSGAAFAELPRYACGDGETGVPGPDVVGAWFADERAPMEILALEPTAAGETEVVLPILDRSRGDCAVTSRRVARIRDGRFVDAGAPQPAGATRSDSIQP